MHLSPFNQFVAVWLIVAVAAFDSESMEFHVAFVAFVAAGVDRGAPCRRVLWLIDACPCCNIVWLIVDFLGGVCGTVLVFVLVFKGDILLASGGFLLGTSLVLAMMINGTGVRNSLEESLKLLGRVVEAGNLRRFCEDPRA
jgi:hypothetical protein